MLTGEITKENSKMFEKGKGEVKKNQISERESRRYI